MKYLVLFAVLVLPCTALATQLANCDRQAYEVTIVNGGQVHTQLLKPGGGSIEEFGPMVSFQIKGQKPVTITEQGDEYCIWHGHITLQRRGMGNDANGGFHLR